MPDDSYLIREGLLSGVEDVTVVAACGDNEPRWPRPRTSSPMVAEGGSLIDPKVVDAVVGVRSHAQDSPPAELTPREHQILAKIATGKSNAAIAESLVPASGRSRSTSTRSSSSSGSRRPRDTSK